MRILIITAGTAFVCLILFLMLKVWGSSQAYLAYSHPFYNTANKTTEPVLFEKPRFSEISEVLKNTKKNIYIDISSTKDGFILIHEVNKYQTSSFRNQYFKDIKDVVLNLADFKNDLKNRKIIFNLTENAIAGDKTLIEEFQKMGLNDQAEILISSPYEVMSKSLKELAPTYIYAASKPEILRLKAMESFYLIETASVRADVIIHPLYFYKKLFFTETFVQEIKRRNKKIIIGPIPQSEYEEALKLNPFGIVVEI